MPELLFFSPCSILIYLLCCGYHYYRQFGEDGISGALISLVSFLLLTMPFCTVNARAGQIFSFQWRSVLQAVLMGNLAPVACLLLLKLMRCWETVFVLEPFSHVLPGLLWFSGLIAFRCLFL